MFPRHHTCAIVRIFTQFLITHFQLFPYHSFTCARLPMLIPRALCLQHKLALLNSITLLRLLLWSRVSCINPIVFSVRLFVHIWLALYVFLCPGLYHYVICISQGFRSTEKCSFDFCLISGDLGYYFVYYCIEHFWRERTSLLDSHIQWEGFAQIIVLHNVRTTSAPSWNIYITTIIRIHHIRDT